MFLILQGLVVTREFPESIRKNHGLKVTPIIWLTESPGDMRIAPDFLDQLQLTGRKRAIAGPLIKEIRERLTFLANVGVEYLTLERTAATLSGGEAQRIRLATQIGSGLSGVLYVLDEPSVGLHARDTARLITTLKRLRDLGNTVIVVEHDEHTIRASDYVVDMGPGAGVTGGEVVATGAPAAIIKNKKSLTGQYLSGSKSIPVPAGRRKPGKKALVIKAAAENNLKHVDVTFPLVNFNLRFKSSDE